MNNKDLFSYLVFVGILAVSIAQAQQIANKNAKKYPAYSLQNMPRTDFTCRDKILGGYYADAETQCQMFHVCVKVAGVGVQDFRFLCPNGTAFDQEAQTCADWGDVDCESATLYYGSDNFDLYRIGSGYESKRAPLADEEESTFHLQRAESNDLRRSKESIINQSNKPHNYGSAFNQQQKLDGASIRPAKQYQPQTTTTTTTTTTTPRPIHVIDRKPSTTVQTYITNKPTPVVGPQTRINSHSYNSNDEIFKGSHSSNFYSNRNSNDDDDDFKSRASTTASKSRHRQRGRTHYRGTPATTSTTTFKPYSPVNIQNYTTSTSRPAFSAQSTTLSPFRFTFSPTIQPSLPANNGNQIVSSTPLGPLQQQYHQPIYNNNNFGSYKLASTTIPSTTTQFANRNTLNTVLSTQSSFSAPLPVVSVPAPFNINPNTNNNNNAFANTNNNNKNLFNPNPTNNNLNNNKQQNGRFFDNHNPVNNYQTTSPFVNQPIFNKNQFFAPIYNNNATKLAPTNQQSAQFNQFAQQPTFNHNQQFVNNGTYQSQNQRQSPQQQLPQQQQQQRFFDQRLPASSTPQSAIAQTQIPRKPFKEEPPNFKQQDYLHQYNLEQQRLKQTTSTTTSTERNAHNSRKPELTLEQRRLQLHYDINDYLSTDKFTSRDQYSPTSEQYRSVQTYAMPANHKPYQNIDQTYRTNIQNQKSAETFTQKYNVANQAASQSQTPFTFSPTPASNKQQYEQYKQFQSQPRNQSPVPQQSTQSYNQNLNVQSTKSPYPTQIQRQSQPATTQAPFPASQTVKSNDNSVEQTPVKKFSTLVPKEYYAPTTFKPFNYFNVAKQINDNLSTPSKSNAKTGLLTSSTTHRTASVTSTVNRNAVPTQNDYQRFQNAQPTQFPQFPQFKPIPASLKPINLTEIDENDGQYHPELYEKDFARYKIKSRKKQQQQKQTQQQSAKQNNFNNAFNSFNNNNNNYQSSNNRFSTSTEEEFLNTAHSQNIAASGNELRAANAKNIANAKSQFKAPSNAPTISPNATTTKKPQAKPQDDKDVSYDYAYYDSANDTPHDYSEFDLSDFGKTRAQ